MNPRDELVLDVRAWLDTWAPNCGAPRAVFEGQFRALIESIANVLPPNADPEDVAAIIRRACR